MPKRRKDDPDRRALPDPADLEAPVEARRAKSDSLPPVFTSAGRWVPMLTSLFERFALAMLMSEEQRAIAIFEITPGGGSPFAQFMLEPCGVLLDLPTSSVDGGARERLLASGLGLARGADVPRLRPSDADIRDFDPLRKDYGWHELERAARELAFLLFDFWAAPPAGPVFLTWWAEGGTPEQRIVLVDRGAEQRPVN